MEKNSTFKSDSPLFEDGPIFSGESKDWSFKELVVFLYQTFFAGEGKKMKTLKRKKTFRRDERSIIGNGGGESVWSIAYFIVSFLMVYCALFCLWLFAQLSTPFVLGFLWLIDRKTKAKVESKRVEERESDAFSDDNYGSEPSTIIRCYFMIFVEGRYVDVQVSSNTYDKFDKGGEIEIFFFEDAFKQVHVWLGPGLKIFEIFRLPVVFVGFMITLNRLWITGSQRKMKYLEVREQREGTEPVYFTSDHDLDSPLSPYVECGERKAFFVSVDWGGGEITEIEVSQEIYDKVQETGFINVQYVDGIWGSSRQMRPVFIENQKRRAFENM